MSSNEPAWQARAEALLDAAPGAARWSPQGSSTWASAWRLEVGKRSFFVKVARGRFAAMASAEADGLRALAASRALRVPDVIAADTADDAGVLVLEWLPLGARADDVALGRALAALHRAPPPRPAPGARFGLARDNWIGGTPQRNAPADDWATFFRDARLAPQFELAARRRGDAALARDGERLLAAVPALLAGHAPAPSLVHGDLWSGNAAGLPDGTPVVFDPAVYVGDREVDLAMTELFGGFAPAFHAAYREAWPLADGYPRRRTLYNLYHLLNHVNLFGESYLPRVRQAVAALLAELR